MSEDQRPFKDLRQWLRRKWETAGARILAAVVAVVLLLILTFLGLLVFEVAAPSEALVDVLALAILVILGFFIHLFTTPLPEKSDDQTFVDLKRKWMFLAYTFMVLALAVAVYPFAVDLKLDPGDPEYINEINATLDSPIAVFRGCVIGPEAAARALHCYPGGDERQPPALSWVLQVGGYVSPFQFEIPRETRPEKLEDARAALRQAADETAKLKQILDDRKAALTELPAGAPQAGNDASEPEAGAEPPPGPRPEEIVAARKAASEAEQRLVAAREKEEKARNQLRISLQWQRYEQGNSGFSVSGGLVVPFYLVVLSLIGGAISLTRRIPEYQKQAAPGYVGTSEAPYLTPPMLREYLVFQIVQFISAPFIAAVAYYVIEPTTTSTTVGLAFAAGFASETVLLWVRAVVDKLMPAAPGEQANGSLVGSLSGQSGKSAAETEKAYNISIVGHPGLPAVFSDGGQFVIDGLPKGACALEVIRLGTPDSAPQTICRRVTIEAGKPTPVTIDLT